MDDGLYVCIILCPFLFCLRRILTSLWLTELRCCPSYVKQISNEILRGNVMLNFSFIDWRSLDQTCEINHAGSNLMLMENGLLSFLNNWLLLLYNYLQLPYFSFDLGIAFEIYIMVSPLILKLGSAVAQWLKLDSRPRGRGSEPHQRHYVLSLSKTHLS